MTRTNESTSHPEASVSIEKAILSDLCLGYPLGRLSFASLLNTPLPPEMKAPPTYLFRGEQLAALKHASQTGHAQAIASIEALVAAADAALKSPMLSVTDKAVSRFSDTPHDYQSLAKYYWPAEGSSAYPWVRRDGDINPECYSPDFDYLRLVRLSEDSTLLAITAYLTDQPAYGAHATQMLQRWFLDPETRQTPHFERSQIAPQSAEGPFEKRWPGVIEARFLIYVTEAVRLLESTGHLSQAMASGLRQWFSELLDWMLDPQLVQRTSQAANNITLWHGLQCMTYADFCGRSEVAERFLHTHLVPQIERQISPDGTLPSELDRAYPQDYVIFSIAAMALISRVGEHHNTALWDQKHADGRNFQAAHDWLLRATQSSHSPLTHINFTPTLCSNELDHDLDAALKLRALERFIRISEVRANQLEAERSRWEKSNSALQDQHEKLTRLVAELHDKYKKEKAQVDSLRKKISVLEQAQRNLNNHATRLESLVDTLLTSLSWRITRPLRTILRLSRGQRRAETREDFIPTRPASLTPLSSEKKSPSSSPRNSFIQSTHHALKRFITHSPEEYLTKLRKTRPADEEALKAVYQNSQLSQQPDTFVLYRIIGNDLYPRHRIGQSRDNLRFVLENEPQLENCEKRWVVNRIVDAEEERQIIELLTAHKQEYIHIPFIAEDYRLIDWDFDSLPTPNFLDSEAFRKLSSEEQERARVALYRFKNLYVMNNNGARNTALRDGRERAKWVLPWDGNCFITASAWRDIITDVTTRPHLKYFAVPMERMLDNADLLRNDYRPNPVEEPQLLFRCDASEEFNEAFPYGRRPKVELFWRLGIPGMWNNWCDDPWDPPRRQASPETGQFGCAGWVARMFSGQQKQEKAHDASRRNRLLARRHAIMETLDYIDTNLNSCSQQITIDQTVKAGIKEESHQDGTSESSIN